MDHGPMGCGRLELGTTDHGTMYYGTVLKTCRWRILIRSVWFGPIGCPNTMSILKFIPKDVLFVEKRFRQDVWIMLKTYRWRILMCIVWFGHFGCPNRMSIVKCIPKDIVFVEKRFWQDVGIKLKTYRSRLLMRSVWFGPFGRPNTMSCLKIPEVMVFVENVFDKMSR